MSFKFEVPGCMQNKVGCFVDLSDSAIYDESGGIPTTEDLEAVIDYNLTENCPKWMMQYPEHAGLIGAYIAQADTVRQAFKSMMPKQGDFYGGSYSGKQLIKAFVMRAILDIEFKKILPDYPFKTRFTIPDALTANFYRWCNLKTEGNLGNSIIPNLITAVNNYRSIRVENNRIHCKNDGEYVSVFDDEDNILVGDLLVDTRDSELASDAVLWINLTSDVHHSFSYIKWAVKGIAKLSIKESEVIGRRVTEKFRILDSIFNIDKTVDYTQKPKKPSALNKVMLSAVLAAGIGALPPTPYDRK